MKPRPKKIASFCNCSGGDDVEDLSGYLRFALLPSGPSNIPGTSQSSPGPTMTCASPFRAVPHEAGSKLQAEGSKLGQNSMPVISWPIQGYIASICDQTFFACPWLGSGWRFSGVKWIPNPAAGKISSFVKQGRKYSEAPCRMCTPCKSTF